jgi:hypothetical protein
MAPALAGWWLTCNCCVVRRSSLYNLGMDHVKNTVSNNAVNCWVCICCYGNTFIKPVTMQETSQTCHNIFSFSYNKMARMQHAEVGNLCCSCICRHPFPWIYLTLVNDNTGVPKLFTQKGKFITDKLQERWLVKTKHGRKWRVLFFRVISCVENNKGMLTLQMAKYASLHVTHSSVVCEHAQSKTFSTFSAPCTDGHNNGGWSAGNLMMYQTSCALKLPTPVQKAAWWRGLSWSTQNAINTFLQQQILT